LRVAASITHLGLSARLIAPALAATASGYRLDMPLGDLWWQDQLGGPVPLSIPRPADDAARPFHGQNLPDKQLQELMDGVIDPITAATSRLVKISQRVLWGNVASAINSAWVQVTAQVPELGAPAHAAAVSASRHRRLIRERQPPGPAFRRTSCCLLYRLTPGSSRPVCGDCVLASR